MFRHKLMAATAIAAASVGVSSPAQAGASDYIGEIIPVGYTFCPRGTADASGQLLPIASNSALFSLYGTYYGGDGITTFALPDLRGRAPLSAGQGPGLSNYPQGSRSGMEATTYTISNLPSHTHSPRINVVRAQADTKASPNASFARATDDTYNETTAPGADQMSAGTMTSTAVGGGQSVNNMQPSLTMRYCVNLVGIYPSRN